MAVPSLFQGNLCTGSASQTAAQTAAQTALQTAAQTQEAQLADRRANKTHRPIAEKITQLAQP